jgi:hypothetical protein
MREHHGPPLNTVQCAACGAGLAWDPDAGQSVALACGICGQAMLPGTSA